MRKATLSYLMIVAGLITGFPTETRADETQPGKALVPTAELLDRLESLPDEHPLFVMTLVKFDDDQGAKLYQKLSSQRLPILRKMGGELLFFGKARPHDEPPAESHHVLGLEPNPWDYIVLERYSSRKDLRRLIESKELASARAAAEQHVKAITIYALNGTARTGKENVYPRSKAEKVVDPDLPAGQTHYEINLLQFKPNDGESIYYDQYAAKVMPLLNEISAKVVYGFKPELCLVGDETYHRVILVSYPSTKTFTEMIYSDDYAAISPKRTRALQVGHLFGFENVASSIER